LTFSVSLDGLARLPMRLSMYLSPFSRKRLRDANTVETGVFVIRAISVYEFQTLAKSVNEPYRNLTNRNVSSSWRLRLTFIRTVHCFSRAFFSYFF